MKDRTKYYTFLHFPNKITLSPLILYMLVETKPEISNKAFELALNETRNDIIDWLDKNIGKNNYSIDEKISHHTVDPEEMVSNIFEGEINIVVNNSKDILNRANVPLSIIEEIDYPLKITLGQNFNVSYDSKLSKLIKEEIKQALTFYLRKPAFEYLGDEHLPHKYFLNVSKVAKEGYTKDVANNYIIKSKSNGEADLIGTNDPEYLDYKLTLDKLKLSRNLSRELEANDTSIRKMKI